MDVVRLGLPYTTAYVPDTLVEGYSSFIWTERFGDPGEFELKTPYVAKTLDLLPEMSLVSHLKTDAVAMVENRLITQNADGNYELTVSGRTLDAFLEHRFIEADYQKKRKMARKYGVVGAADVLVWQAVDNTSGKDVTRAGDFAWTTLDAIPNTVVTQSATAVGAVGTRYLEQGLLYPQLRDMIDKVDMAVRVIRPTKTSQGDVISVQITPVSARGTVTKTWTTGIDALRFDIYDGTDRSATVVFNYLHGDVNNPQYLFSVKDMKTALEIVSKQGGADIYRNGTESAYTGLRRRVGIFDGGDVELPAEPKPPKPLRRNHTRAQKNAYDDKMDAYLDAYDAWEIARDLAIAEFQSDYQESSTYNLSQMRRISLLTGDISPLAPYQFKKDYNLGDLVTLKGEYGEVQKMLVSEYTFTEDNEGDRGFPGLELP